MSCQLLAGPPSAKQLNLRGHEYIWRGPVDDPLECGWTVSLKCLLGKLAKLPLPSHFRTQFLDQTSPSSAWMEPRYKEAANHCALLQEHAQRCYVRGEQEATGGSSREET